MQELLHPPRPTPGNREECLDWVKHVLDTTVRAVRTMPQDQRLTISRPDLEIIKPPLASEDEGCNVNDTCTSKLDHSKAKLEDVTRALDLLFKYVHAIRLTYERKAGA